MKLISFYLKYYRNVVVLSVLVGVLAGVSSAAMMVLIGIRVSNPSAPVVALGWAFVGLAIFDLIASLASGALSIKLQQRINFDLSMSLCKQVLSAPLRVLEEAGSHKILAALGSDMGNITGAFLRVPGLCINLAILIGCLGYLAWLSSTMFLVLSFFLVLAIVSYLLPEKKAKHYLKLAREHWDIVFGHYRALNDGAKELKLHRNRRNTFYNDFVKADSIKLRRHSLKGGTIYVFLGVWSHMLYFFIIGMVLFVLPGMLGGIEHMVLTGYALTALYIRGPISSILGIIPALSSARVSLQKIEKLGLSMTAIDIKDGETNDPEPNRTWTALDLVGITHTYYREKEDASFQLGPIDLTLFPGEMIFLVGGNGSGKTTLVKMLTGLYSPEDGFIRMNGSRVTDKNRDDYRQYFSSIFADFYLFEKLMGVHDQDLDERASDYISQLQLGQKVSVKDGTLSTLDLSFGQRKRLALLTAYLEDRPIYVFDEWASGQDPTFKEFFYVHLLPELKARGKTIIVVTHDDRYFHLADRIIKLEYGKLEYDERLSSEQEEAIAVPSL